MRDCHGDRDSFAYREPGYSVLLVSTGKGRTETAIYDENALLEKYGIKAERMKDLKGLMGDSSDNIPGVAGIGEKTALELVRNHGCIEDIYENIDSLDIKESVRSKLVNGKDSAFLSKRLATIDLNVPIEFTPSGLMEYDRKELLELFRDLEFQSLIKRLGLTEEITAVRPAYDTGEVKTPEVLEKLIRELESSANVSVACAPGFDAVALDFGSRGVSVCARDFGKAEYDGFLRLLFSDRVKKTAHDIKAYIVALNRDGITASGFVSDTALAAYLADPLKKSYSLDEVSKDICPDIPVDESEYSRDGAFSALGDFGKAKEALIAAARATGIIGESLKSRLKELDMEKLYADIELPLCRVLADMQITGFKVDGKTLLKFGEDMRERMEDIAERVFELSGFEFNILSPKQLGEVLFEKLMLPAVKKTKTGYSTDIEVLEKLKDMHGIVPLLIDYRKYSKLKSTYVDGLIKEISAADGRIHSNFKQMMTATGRISSTEPNLQNIPIRYELGGEIRKLFVPESSDWTLIDADYSQIELRVLAHIADDEVMKNAFITGSDIHTITASQVFGVPEAMVDSEMRRAAKAVNFGIVYGISDFSLAQDLNIGVYQAKRYIENYLEKYSGVRAYMKDIIERAKRDGYVTTVFGRRRDLPELNSKNHNIRSFGERVALNTPIQGTAADIIKIAMVRIYNRLISEKLESRLVLQVHDELIVEAKKTEAEYVRRLVKEEMEARARCPSRWSRTRAWGYVV